MNEPRFWVNTVLARAELCELVDCIVCRDLFERGCVGSTAKETNA